MDATRIWTTSQAAADSFATDFDVPRDRLRTIYAGANVEPEAPPARTVYQESPPLVLFVGKQHVRKGSPVLLEAFGAVRRAIPNAELHIVGAVPPGSDAPGVAAHGFVASDTPDGLARLRDLYRRATVFCMPSRYEPFGVVFLEAMLAGLPCIGTDRWAMPEIIADGETGWISPDGDAPALAACLIEALGDRQRCIEMGRRGRERVLERFTWDKVAERARLDLEQIVG